MADTRSGAGQICQFGTANTVISGEDQGFGGLNFNEDPATFAVESAGKASTHNAGTTVLTGDFTVSETDLTAPLIHGQNGTRHPIRWRKGASVDGYSFTAICVVSRTFEDRGRRLFSVAFTVDGDEDFDTWSA